MLKDYSLKLLRHIYKRSTYRKSTRFIGSTSVARATSDSSTSSGPKEQETNCETIQEEDKNDLIQVSKHGPVTIIGLNRSKKRNAINQPMALKICDAITDFENDETSTVGVLHGIGGSFSSGYDMDDLRSETLKLENLMNAEGCVGPTRRIIKKPMVCGISGFCIANGLELALMCDLRVIEDDAFLGFFNRRFGIPLMDGGTVRLPAMIGLSRALELILTGRVVTAKEAFEMGLANRIVAPGTSLGQSVNLARSINKFPQAALNHDRNAIYTSAFESQSFDKSCMNELMSLSKSVVDEMQKGAEQFKSGIGRSGKYIDLKESTMADWELEEYRRELKANKIKNDQKDEDFIPKS